MTHEAAMHEKNCFVTLTYSDQELPRDGKINKHHIQTFIKRLRYHEDVRYFVTGEYGEQTARPHYHAILFGIDFLGGSYAIDHQLYGSPILDCLWDRGNCAIGEVSFGSALYTAGYVQKKIHDRDTFALMSRKPPLGRDWAEKNMAELQRTGQVVIDGRVFPIPSRYFDWFPQELDHIKGSRNPLANIRSSEVLRNRQINHDRKPNRDAKL